jgi:ketosteroid isomerase-like protein
MRAFFAAVMILAVVVVSSTMALGRGAPGADADTLELTRLAAESGRAYAARDLTSLERITADDYVQTDVRGGVLSRAQWLEFVKNRPSEITVETDDVSVRYYDGVAVVTGHWIYKKNESGQQTFVTYSRWTSVWTKFPDGWKRHVFQNTYISPHADCCEAPPVK